MKIFKNIFLVKAPLDFGSLQNYKPSMPSYILYYIICIHVYIDI